MYITNPMFWIKLFFTIGMFLLLLFIFNYLIRKFLKIEKGKVFSYNHVNKNHKKVDWIIRISFVIIILTSQFLIMTKGGRYNIWYLQIWFIMIAFVIISQITRAFMEWKYSEESKRYLFTISQLIFVLILLFILIYTNFFNFFKLSASKF